MTQRRILFLFNAFENDAPSSITFALARGAYQAGFKVLCVAWSRGGNMTDQMHAAGLQTIVLSSSTFWGDLHFMHSMQKSGIIENADHVPRRLKMFNTAHRLAKVINQFKPHLVHSILVRPNFGVTFSQLIGTREDFVWVAADHGIHEWCEKGQIYAALTSSLLPSVLSRADAIVAVSEAASTDLVRKGIPSHKLHVIPNGVDARRFYPRPRSDRSAFLDSKFSGDEQSSDIILIGSAGNLRHLKGHDILIKAAALVQRNEPRSRFVIWGTGPELPYLQDLVKQLNLKSVVTFCGYEPAIEHKLPLLDLYVQPSRNESFGLAAAEAMSCGVPTIASDVGGLRYLIEHEQSGLKFPPEDSVALANQILLILQRKRLRKKLGTAGRLRILQRYSQQGMVNAGLALYNGLLEAKRK